MKERAQRDDTQIKEWRQEKGMGRRKRCTDQGRMEKENFAKFERAKPELLSTDIFLNGNRDCLDEREGCKRRAAQILTERKNLKKNEGAEDYYRHDVDNALL